MKTEMDLTVYLTIYLLSQIAQYVNGSRDQYEIVWACRFTEEKQTEDTLMFGDTLKDVS